ncbi:hypothetical protein [Nocardia africana]|uniref:hypothetical protein n=1 Tax=Nocardia africana TaxID=134964 RepID=UPI0007A5085C|nr:hypothetical protein [Nocardia africana]MCC3312757.1 hypothetical protein [Nocardia africana]
MLKPYKEVQRWFPALEPEHAVPTAAPGESEAVDDEAEPGAARYPHYIRDTEPEPFDIPFADEPATRRSEFVGGWTDWVGGHAPGPDDDYSAHEGEVLRLPRDAETGEGRARGRRRTRPAGADGDDAEGSGARPPMDDPDERDDVDTPEWILPPRREHGDGAGGRIVRRAPGPASPALRDYIRPSRLRVALVLAVAVLLLAAAGVFALYLLRSGDHGKQSVAPLPARPALGDEAPMLRLTSAIGADSGPQVGSAGHCPTERSARVMRGAEVGGTDSGPDAIMWFQHAFYVERSAERAREVVAPDAAVSPAPVIQRGIASVPLGTDYCVRVVTLDDNRYSVEVTERRPGAAPATYDKQLVTTAVVGGRTLITGITAG